MDRVYRYGFCRHWFCLYASTDLVFNYRYWRVFVFCIFYQPVKLSKYPSQSETKFIKDSQASANDPSQNLEAAKTRSDIKKLKVDSEAMCHKYIEKEKALQELLIESRMQRKKEANLKYKFEFVVETAD